MSKKASKYNNSFFTLLSKNLPAFTLGLLLLVVVPLTISLFNTQNQLQQHAAGSGVYYVSPSGNDTNNGSLTTPFLTIQKAANVVVAGDTVHVLPGTYTGAVINTTSGTASAPITYISDTKWGAKITTNGGLKDFPFRNNGNYVHIVNFDITSSTSWIGILTYGQFNVIQGNHVHNLTAMACNGSPGGTGIGDDTISSNNSFIGNVVNNIGSYPTKCDYVHGIYPDGSGDIIKNNITYNNAGNGIYCNHGTGNMTIANNTTFANGEYGIGINGTTGADNFIVTNNIIMANGIAGMKTWATVTGTHNQFLNNLFSNNPTMYVQSGTGTLQNTVSADPQFVNYQANGTGDYHLKATSPAIDAGNTLGAPTTDFDGNPRPQGTTFDIGAYEFALPVTPTLALSATPTLVPTVTNTPTPTLTPSPVPTSTPTPIAGVIIGQDTFKRANQSLWGFASDGQKWGGDANSNSVFSIAGNVGKLVSGSGGNNYNAVLGANVTNAQILFTGSISSFSSSNFGGVLRCKDANNWYKAYIDGTTLYIQKSVNGTKTTVKSVSFSASTNTSYTIRFQVIGSTLSTRVWKTANTEPTVWTLNATDTSLTSGYAGLRTLLKSGVTTTYTSFQAAAL